MCYSRELFPRPFPPRLSENGSSTCRWIVWFLSPVILLSGLCHFIISSAGLSLLSPVWNTRTRLSMVRLTSWWWQSNSLLWGQSALLFTGGDRDSPPLSHLIVHLCQLLWLAELVRIAFSVGWLSTGYVSTCVQDRSLRDEVWTLSGCVASPCCVWVWVPAPTCTPLLLVQRASLSFSSLSHPSWWAWVEHF